jgi:hypothetical protein
MWFELLLYALLLGVGTYLYLRHQLRLPAYIVAGAPALLFIVFRAAPPARRLVYLGWIYATFPIGLVLSHALFLVLFFVVLTPIGCLRRTLGRPAVPRTFDRERESYWQPMEQDDRVERYFKQY